MSLLEDVFLENEAGEAQELERIIEGDEYDERPRPSTPDSNENSEKEDEAEEDRRHVDPTSAKPKRIVKNPRVVLNPARLTGPRGIQVIPEHFKDFTFKGKGREKEDLDLVLKMLEHWAYRLYPKFEFKDCLKKMETLGNKRAVVVHLTKIRTDQFISEETIVQRDSSDDEAPAPVQEEDEFDKLLQQQIELARATPAPGPAKGFTTPMADKSIMPKATSSPSINDEQRERMLRSRRLAEERRLARLKLKNSETGHENSADNAENNTRLENNTNNTLGEEVSDNNASEGDRNVNSIKELPLNTIVNEKDAVENITRMKINRSNVIDSSDSEDDALVINESVTVDVHGHRNDSDEESDIHIQNQNDEDKSTNIEHKTKKDKRHTDIIQENDNEINSNIDLQNKIGDYTSDVEMIDNVNDSRSTENQELVELNKINTNSKDSTIDVIETTKSNVDLEILTETNDDITLVGKEGSENENNLKNAADQSVENTKEADNNKETATADVDDVMDVDFSDDF